jgi:urease accessory protein
MIRISERLAEPRVAEARLVLPFDLRSRSRFRAQLDTGEEVGVTLTRGFILRGGDQLLADDGRVVSIEAARETVSTGYAEDPRVLARAAYHLGNRHVALEIGAGWLRYSHDHVLDDMVIGLGLRLAVTLEPFEPESGAYQLSQGHSLMHARGGAGGHHHDH